MSGDRLLLLSSPLAVLVSLVLWLATAMPVGGVILTGCALLIVLTMVAYACGSAAGNAEEGRGLPFGDEEEAKELSTPVVSR